MLWRVPGGAQDGTETATGLPDKARVAGTRQHLLPADCAQTWAGVQRATALCFVILAT